MIGTSTDGKSNLTGFQAVQRVRGDVSDMAQSAAQSGHGNKARLLRGVLRRLDQSLENASEGFLQANRNFAQASRDIKAVQAGRQAATRGRSADVIPAYQTLRLEAQAAFRSGHVEPLIGQTVIGIPQTSRDVGYWVPDLIFPSGFFFSPPSRNAKIQRRTKSYPALFN